MQTKIVVTTWGSLGDLYPFLAVASRLQSRGHKIEVATSEYHRCTVEEFGLVFHPIPPDIHDLLNNSGLLTELVHSDGGAELLLDRILFPALKSSYDQLLAVCHNASVVVSSDLVFAAPLVAEKLGIPWFLGLLQPHTVCSFNKRSANGTPSITCDANAFNGVAPQPGTVANERKRRVGELRATLGMTKGASFTSSNGCQAPVETLALFSHLMIPPRASLPDRTRVTGFPFSEICETTKPLEPALERFLVTGDPPIVFTLGSAMVHAPLKFFETSLAAVRVLRRRGILVVGRQDCPSRCLRAPDGDVYITDYVSFSDLFPRSSVIVHHGGIGTLSLALKAGRPMLIVPHAFDQADNSARAERLGVAQVLLPNSYTSATVASTLMHLLTRPRYQKAAERAAEQIRNERGVRDACNVIETQLKTNGSLGEQEALPWTNDNC